MSRRGKNLAAIVILFVLGAFAIWAGLKYGDTGKSSASKLSASSGSVFVDFQKFVSDSQAASYYPKWTSQNPGEVSRWTPFRDGILGGNLPPAPTMSTKYGAALVDAGVEYEDSVGGVVTTTGSTIQTTTAQTTTAQTTTAQTTTAQTTTVAAGCSTTVSSVTAAQSAVSAALGGQTVCITAGTYGGFSFSTSKTSNVNFQPVPGAKVTTGSIFVNGSYLTVKNFVVNGGVFFNYPANHDTISYSNISNPGGFGVGIDGGLGNSPVSPQPGVHDVTITHNKIHDNCLSGSIASCEGDAFHISGWGQITITYNEVYGQKQNTAPNASHTDILQSYQAGFTTGKDLVFDHNYLHDNDCEGFFLKDGAVTNITYTQNLGLRNPSDGHPMDVYDTTNFVVNHNTDWNSSLAVLEGFGTMTYDHNVWDDFENVGSWTITKNNNIYGSQPFTSPFSSLSSGESVNPSPGFVSPSTDDFRLLSNPNNLGVNWRPADQAYGPQ